VCISTENSDEGGVDGTGNVITYMFVRSIYHLGLIRIAAEDKQEADAPN